MGSIYSAPIARQPGSLYGHYIRKSFKAEGISQQNAEYYLQRKSQDSQKHILCKIHKWEVNCMEKQVNPCTPSLDHLAGYIHYLYSQMDTGSSIIGYFHAVKACVDSETLKLFQSDSIRRMLLQVALQKLSIPKSQKDTYREKYGMQNWL